MLAHILQSRITKQSLFAFLQTHQFWQRLEIPRHNRARTIGSGLQIGYRTVGHRCRCRRLRHRLSRDILETRARLRAKMLPQQGQIAAHLDLPTVFVQQFEIHERMRRKCF